MSLATNPHDTMPLGVDSPVTMAYYALLGEIHRQFLPRTYLEIGIRDGESLKRAPPTTRCLPAIVTSTPISAFCR